MVRALDHMHSKNVRASLFKLQIVHRDIKPENFLIKRIRSHSEDATLRNCETPKSSHASGDDLMLLKVIDFG